MNQCPNCKLPVYVGAKICTYCAADLSQAQQSIPVSSTGAAPAQACSNCGASLSPGTQFCANCSAPAANSSLGNVPYPSARKSPTTIGIIIAIIGVALIIISPSLLFTKTVGTYHPGIVYDPTIRTTDLRDAAMFCGVALLVVGGIISALGFSKSTSTQPTMPPAATTQPVVTQSVSPKSIELGNTPDEVQSIMGQPDKIINLDARVIHVYKDMKIIYVDGKVSDVQLS